jgi:hypothetical protein
MVVLASPTASVAAATGDDFGRRAAATNACGRIARRAIHHRTSARPQSQLPHMRTRLSTESELFIAQKN